MSFSAHNLWHFLSRRTPKPIRQFLNELRWARGVDSSMRRLLALPRGVVPSPELLRRLSAAWGNEGFTARPEYVEAVARQAAITDAPILECGSGVTTLVLAAVAGRRGIRVCSLEQDAAWAARVSRRLAAVGLKGNSVLVKPLVRYDGYDWYGRADEISELQFGLVVCDGPSGDTPGGRYGLLPRMKSQLAPGALILLDDALRESEQSVLRRWLAEGCASVVETSAPRTFSVVKYR